MATKSAGRVSIRVLPDSTRFRSELQKALDRIEKTMKAKIPVELDVSREQIMKLKRQIESIVVKIKPTIELNISLKELEELKAKIEQIKPKIDVELNTKEAATRMAALSRSREVDLWVRIREIGGQGVNSFASRLKALAGLNLSIDALREGSQFMDNIDRKAVQFAQTMAKSAALIGTIGSSLASSMAILGDAMNVGKLALFAPAVLTSAGIAIAAMVVVFKDMGKVLGDLKPRFSALQDAMSNEFWKKAAQPIRDLVNKYWPVLDQRLQHTARNLGRLTATFADTINESLGAERLDIMFKRMNYAIADMRPTVASLTRAFINIGEVGTRFFERFTTWTAKLSKQFEDFIQKAYDDGRLEQWFNDGIKAALDLGRVVGGLTETLNGIYRAAKAAGAPGLNEFANGMERLADIMQSSRMQANLKMLFQGMLELFAGITRGIKNIAPDIESFLPTLTFVLGRFGKIFEDAFGIIGTVISNPQFQKGVQDFAVSVEKALGNLKGGADNAATSFGNLLSFMGSVLDMGTRLLNEVLTKLGPEFDDILDSIKPLLKPVEDVANSAIGALKNVLDVLGKDILPPVVKLFGELAPVISGTLDKITPERVGRLKILGDLVNELANGLKTLKDNLGPLQEGNDWEWLGDLLFTGGGAGGKFGGRGNPIEDAIDNWMRGIDWAKVGSEITKMWDTFWKHVVDGWNRMWSGRIFGDQPKTFIDDTIQNLKNAFKPLNDFLDGLFKPGSKVGEAKGGGGGIGGRSLSGVIGVEPDATTWVDKLKASITTNLGTLGGTITTGAAGAKVAWDTWWSNLNTGLSTTWETIKLGVQTKMGEIGGNITTGGATAKLAWDTWWSNLSTNLGTTWEGIKTTVSTKMGEIGPAIQTGGELVKTGWDTFWSGVGNTLQGKFGEYSGTAGRGMGEVKRNVDSGMAGVSAGWGQDWSAIGNDMNGKWDGIVGDVRSKAGQVSPEMVAQMNVAQRMWTDSWNYVKTLTASAWVNVSDAIRSGMSTASSVMSAFRGMATSALNINLSGSGSSMMQSFAAGISAASPWVSGAVQRVIAAAKAFFPNSPAKVGPFSGKGYTPWSGRALVKDFAGGMMDNVKMVKTAANRIVDAAQIGSSAFYDVDTPGVTVTRKHVTLNINNPQAEPSSRTIEKGASLIRIAGDL